MKPPILFDANYDVVKPRKINSIHDLLEYAECCTPPESPLVEKYAFGHIPPEMKCNRCREFDLDGCPSCPGFGDYS